MSADRKRERGAALAELAMVVPVMLAMLLVVYDFGRGFHAYISVTNGARHAARMAMNDDRTCSGADIAAFAQNGSSPYAVTVSEPVETDGLCYVTVSYDYTPVLPFIGSSFDLPGIGTVGPLWDGSMSETAVAKVDGKTGDGSSGTSSSSPSPSAEASVSPEPTAALCVVPDVYDVRYNRALTRWEDANFTGELIRVKETNYRVWGQSETAGDDIPCTSSMIAYDS